MLALVAAIYPGMGEMVEGKRIASTRPALVEPVRVASTGPALVEPAGSNDGDSNGSNVLSTDCALRPERRRGPAPVPPAIRGRLPLSRFRASRANNVAMTNQTGLSRELLQAATAYTPREQIALAHPTNFGSRFLQDVSGRPVNNEPIVVLHETVGSAQSVIGYFQTPHPNDDDQVSYHSMIRLDGTIVYMVPPDKRAFGAGNSVFDGAAGREAVRTNAEFPPSVNNFAYHISLETPPDGRHNGRAHSGYTNAQYWSLAWLVSRTGVPDERITTHQLVDRSGSRRDPRSFNGPMFLRMVNVYPRTNDIQLQCAPPTSASR